MIVSLALGFLSLAALPRPALVVDDKPISDALIRRFMEPRLDSKPDYEDVGFYLIDTPRGLVAISESVLGRKETQDKKALLTRLSNGLMDSDGAIHLNKLSGEDLRLARKFIQQSFGEDRTRQIERGGGCVFFRPEPYVDLEFEGKTVGIHRPDFFTSAEQEKRALRDAKPVKPLPANPSSPPQQINFGIQNRLTLHYMFAQTKATIKKELSIAALTAIAEEQVKATEELDVLYRTALGKALSPDQKALLAALEKGGSLSDLSPDTRQMLEMNVVGNYSRYGFASEADCRSFLAGAKIRPTEGSCYLFGLFAKEEGEGQVSFSGTSVPSWVNRAG